MITVALLLATSPIHLASAEVGDLRWRRFVHSAVAQDTPFATRIDELRRSVRQLRGSPQLPTRRGISGPSGL